MAELVDATDLSQRIECPGGNPRCRTAQIRGTLSDGDPEPFFIDAVLTLTTRTAAASLPATETELLALWWRLGGSDKSDFAGAQHRRNALLGLAEEFAKNPNQPIAISGIPPEPLAELQQAGVVREVELGHSLAFTHDIYEEWALCQLLIRERNRIVPYLFSVQEPQALVRPVQLMASHLLENDPTAKPWRELYEIRASRPMRSATGIAIGIFSAPFTRSISDPTENWKSAR